MGSRWLIRRFRTGPQSEPRGHVSSTRSPVAGVGLASEGVRSVPPVTPALHSGAEDSRAAERQRPSGRGPRARERRLQARLAQQPTPTVPTAAACARRAFRGTRVVARRNALSTSSSSTPPSGPARPFRLARVPPAGHDQHRRPARNHPGDRTTQGPPTVRPSPAVPSREGTPAGHDQHRRPARNHPGDRTTQGPLYAWSITSRTLSRTNPHAYTDADDNRAVGVASLAPRSLGRPLPPGPLRNGAAWSCGVDERRAAGTLPGAAEGWRIPSGPQIAATAVERRGADAPGVAGTRYREWRDALPDPRPRSCSSRSAIWTCRYWRLSSCPGASGVTASS